MGSECSSLKKEWKERLLQQEFYPPSHLEIDLRNTTRIPEIIERDERDVRWRTVILASSLDSFSSGK